MRFIKEVVLWVAVVIVVGGVEVSFAETAAATDKKIFAQKLVDDALAKHPEVIILAMHVTPPNSSENVIIASNIGRIGKKADEDDLRVIHTGKPNLEVNKKGDHFEVELVLQDQAGKIIGALGVVFNNEKGKKAVFQKKAEQLRDEMKKQIPSVDKLFEEVK
ncbi:MAG TPA: hypothetical protein VOA41_01610 [Candidatus Dormibacteraeota bacterium]|nr:hypothetical protein [Candidatus Dormibacteraeota bacterium]